MSFKYFEQIEQQNRSELNRKYLFEIVDTDFKEVLEIDGIYENAWIMIIDTYEKRNLDVARNLIKSFVWYSKKYNISVEDIWDYNKNYNREQLSKYEKEIEKYLVLV